MKITNDIVNSIYGNNAKPKKATIKRKFGRAAPNKDGLVDQAADNMERQDKAENTMTNEELHQKFLALKNR